ncbi:MAG: hypothetical protein V3T72_06925 [Thermoanaerobaculia bacterium]
MKKQPVRRSLAILFCLGIAAAPLTAQEEERDALFAARAEILAELAAALVEHLPDGHLAILPPEIEHADQVEAAVVATWETALAAALRRVRGDVRLAERGALEAILREQKFGDSPYADPESAVEVGKIVAARSLLLVRLHEFRSDGHEVRVHVETRLFDVETGELLWSRDLYRGVLPRWLRQTLLATASMLGLTAMMLLGRGWDRRRRIRLVLDELPRRRARLRVDVDSLVRALVDARERLYRTSPRDSVVAVQQACEDLEPLLDRVRHGLPSGRVHSHGPRNLHHALREIDRIGHIVRDLRQAADTVGEHRGDGEALADRMDLGRQALRSTVDAYQTFVH